MWQDGGSSFTHNRLDSLIDHCWHCIACCLGCLFRYRPDMSERERSFCVLKRWWRRCVQDVRLPAAYLVGLSLSGERAACSESAKYTLIRPLGLFFVRPLMHACRSVLYNDETDRLRYLKPMQSKYASGTPVCEPLTHEGHSKIMSPWLRPFSNNARLSEEVSIVRPLINVFCSLQYIINRQTEV